MEPAQRISRYGLYIDTMLPSIPQTSTMAIRTLEKARKIIAEICEMEPAASAILDSLRIEHEARRRAYSPTKLLSGLTRSNGSVREAPALTPSLKDRDTPKLFHSLGRSLSRRNKSRPNLNGVLSDQNPEQVQNQQPPRNDENRPLTSGSSRSVGSFSRRPATASSSNTTKSYAMNSVPENSSPPALTEKLQNQAQPPSAQALPQPQVQPSKAASIEHYKAALMRVEEENYKLLQENAELKRQIRECRCGGTTR